MMAIFVESMENVTIINLGPPPPPPHQKKLHDWKGNLVPNLLMYNECIQQLHGSIMYLAVNERESVLMPSEQTHWHRVGLRQCPPVPDLRGTIILPRL